MARSLENDLFTAYRQGKAYAWHLGDQWLPGLIMETACGNELLDPEMRLVPGDLLCHNCQRVFLARKAKERI